MAKSKMTIGQYAMGLVSVGVLFFVIGYSLQKGKEQGTKRNYKENRTRIISKY